MLEIILKPKINAADTPEIILKSKTGIAKNYFLNPKLASLK
jgi:hypothetical protein